MLYIISGRVIRGDGYGKKLGYPTVNLETDLKKLPPDGVYGGRAKLDGKEYRAGIVIGPESKIEAHVIEYSGDAYGKEVMLTIDKFLRKYQKFETEEELINQIKKDIEQC